MKKKVKTDLDMILFYLPEKGCTTAELSPEDKNEISHRGRALTAMYKKLEGVL